MGIVYMFTARRVGTNGGRLQVVPGVLIHICALVLLVNIIPHDFQIIYHTYGSLSLQTRIISAAVLKKQAHTKAKHFGFQNTRILC